MFALKDLEDGEDLYKLRSSTGKYNMYLYDPVQVSAEYYKKNKQSMIIEKALGDYYYNVTNCYPENWFESDEDVAKKSIEHYENDFANEYYTIQM